MIIRPNRCCQMPTMNTGTNRELARLYYFTVTDLTLALFYTHTNSTRVTQLTHPLLRKRNIG